MRNRYLVCYDVADPKRLAQTYRKMNGFGRPVQYSVFVCDLSPTARVLLEQALTGILNLKEDRVLIVDTGPTEGRGRDCFTTLGVQTVLPSQSAVVV
jgi:CRISPR-associated protein Cas2